MVVGVDKTGVGTTDGVIGGGTRCVGTGALLVTNGGLLSRSIRLDDSVDEDADEYCISGIGGACNASFRAFESSFTVEFSVSWNRFSSAILSFFICVWIRFICCIMVLFSSMDGGIRWL